MNWYSPVLFDLDLIGTIIFILIPVLSVLLIFFIKRDFLWTAPIISTILMIIISLVATGPSLLTVGEYRGMFLGITVPIHITVVAVLTVIAYVAAYMHKSRKK